jgi:hypothetical protein
MSQARRSYALSKGLCGWLVLWLTGAAAASATDDLLRLVPEDVGFCAVVQDLRDHNARLSASPLIKALRESPLGKAPEFQQLEALDQLFQKQFDTDLAKLRDDVLGDAVVFAYRPGPPGKPQEEQGLVLLHARDAKLLEKLVRKLNDAELQSGKLKELKEDEYQGQKYTRRIKPDGEDLYVIRDGTLVYGTGQTLFRRALARWREDDKGKSPLQKALQSGGPGKPLASVWINPRAFDAEMQQNLKSATGSDAAALANFLRYWKAIDGIVLSVALDADLYVNLTVQARTEALPASAQKFFKALGEPSDLAAKLPPDALLACAGRVQFDALFDMLCEFLPTEDAKTAREKADGFMRAAGGRKLDEVLPYLGPDCALCILAPPAEDKDWFPQTFMALAVQPGTDKDRPVDEAVLDAVNWTASTLVFAHNGLGGNPLSVRSTTLEKLKLKYIDGGDAFPPGLRPAYALQHGYLTVGSSPATLVRAGSILSATTKPSKNQPIFWMSVKHLRKFLTDRRDDVADYLAQKEKTDKKEARKRIDDLVGLMSMLDRVELSCPQSGQLSLQVQMSLPLK